jgi:menaquinone-dependent protoporphyrinogen IX oxidase
LTFCRPDEFKEEYKDSDFIVIGSSVVYEDINKNIYEFINNNKKWLVDKKIALFCTCLREEGGAIYLNSALEQLGNSVVWAKAIVGRLIIDSLDEVDYTAMKRFSQMIGAPFEDKDKSKTDEIVKCALEIKNIRDHNITTPEEEL